MVSLVSQCPLQSLRSLIPPGAPGGCFALAMLPHPALAIAVHEASVGRKALRRQGWNGEQWRTASLIKVFPGAFVDDLPHRGNAELVTSGERAYAFSSIICAAYVFH